MNTIIFDSKKHSYNTETKTITVSGKDVPFDTSYVVKNPKTNGEVMFELSHSTGSEWDPKTMWVYKSKEGITLKIGNDDVTPAHANAYLQAKLNH